MPQEVSGSEFFEATTRTDPDVRDFKLQDSEGRYITVQLHEINRKELFDELSRLPEGFIDVMMAGADEDLSNIDDPEDVDVDVAGGDVLSHLDGEAIDVFESLFSMSAEHEDLTSLDMESMAEYLSFEVLFEVGGEIIDLSLSDDDEIKRFRGPDSARSS